MKRVASENDRGEREGGKGVRGKRNEAAKKKRIWKKENLTEVTIPRTEGGNAWVGKRKKNRKGILFAS